MLIFINKFAGKQNVRSSKYFAMASNSTFKYLGIIISVLYIIFGIGIIVWQNFFQLEGWVKLAFGALLIAYGAFRMYRALNASKFEE